MVHLHFIIWAATDKIGENYAGVTYLDLMANDMASALQRAKKLCPGRQHYWVNNIIEHHAHSTEPSHQ
jgi:predicted alpha/beta hydrolase